MTRLRRWADTLAPDTLETAFRLHALPRDRRVLSAVMVAAVVFALAGIPTDLALTASTGTGPALVAVRIATAAISLLALPLTRRTRDPRRLDAIALTWILLLVSGVMVGNLLLPADYTMHVIWEVLVVLAIYVTVPLTITRQFVAGMILTVGDVLLLAWSRNLSSVVIANDVALAFACAHVIGVVASWQYRRGHREQFLALREAEDAHTKEQRVRQELTSLQGILRICSNCKRIHTASGDWDQVEVYLTEHTDARFSHGICPQCSVKLYGED